MGGTAGAAGPGRSQAVLVVHHRAGLHAVRCRGVELVHAAEEISDIDGQELLPVDRGLHRVEVERRVSRLVVRREGEVRERRTEVAGRDVHLDQHEHELSSVRRGAHVHQAVVGPVPVPAVDLHVHARQGHGGERIRTGPHLALVGGIRCRGLVAAVQERAAGEEGERRSKHSRLEVHERTAFPHLGRCDSSSFRRV